MAETQKKTKKERIAEEVAKAVGAGQAAIAVELPQKQIPHQ